MTQSFNSPKTGSGLMNKSFRGGDSNMKKLVFMVAAVALAIGLALPQSAEAGSAQSLRGDKSLESSSINPAMPRLKLDQEKFERTFKEQPPLIPHKVKKYQINLKANRCIQCHDKKYYKEEEAPVIGKSHYMGSDGKEMKTINMGRYFCTQCHVPQADAKPLVSNTHMGNK